MELTPLFGITFTFGTAVAIVAIALRHSARKLEHEEIMKALELGQQLPTVEVRKRHSFLTDLRLGVFFLMAGIGIYLWLYFSPYEREYFSVSFIPIAVGVGFLVMAFVLKSVIRNGNGGGSGT